MFSKPGSAKIGQIQAKLKTRLKFDTGRLCSSPSIVLVQLWISFVKRYHFSLFPHCWKSSLGDTSFNEFGKGGAIAGVAIFSKCVVTLSLPVPFPGGMVFINCRVCQDVIGGKAS